MTSQSVRERERGGEREEGDGQKVGMTRRERERE